MEGIFNQQAIQFLQTNADFWRSCQPGELPQETLMLRTVSEPSWIVLTNQRLLHFAVNLRDRTLVREYPRNELLRVRLLEKHEMTRGQKLQRLFNAYGAIVSFEFRDGTSLSGFTVSRQTAQRIAAQLAASPTPEAASNETFIQPSTQAELPKLATPNNKARFQAIASLLIPGLGQWIQRRSGTALIFFVVWLFVLWDAVLIGLTLWKAMSDVSWIENSDHGKLLPAGVWSGGLGNLALARTNMTKPVRIHLSSDMLVCGMIHESGISKPILFVHPICCLWGRYFPPWEASHANARREFWKKLYGSLFDTSSVPDAYETMCQALDKFIAR